MKLYDRAPTIHADAFVAPSATVIGSVTAGPKCTVGYGAVVRGDKDSVTLGASVAVGDRVVISTARPVEGHEGESAAVVGDHALIGPGALLHACTVGICIRACCRIHDIVSNNDCCAGWGARARGRARVSGCRGCSRCGLRGRGWRSGGGGDEGAGGGGAWSRGRGDLHSRMRSYAYPNARGQRRQRFTVGVQLWSGNPAAFVRKVHAALARVPMARHATDVHPNARGRRCAFPVCAPHGTCAYPNARMQVDAADAAAVPAEAEAAWTAAAEHRAAYRVFTAAYARPGFAFAYLGAYAQLHLRMGRGRDLHSRIWGRSGNYCIIMRMGRMAAGICGFALAYCWACWQLHFANGRRYGGGRADDLPAALQVRAW